MRRDWLMGAVVIVLVGSFIYTQSTAAPVKVESKAQIGKPAPDFALKDVFGKEFKLSDFKGKTVVLEWINRQCPISKGKHEAQVMQGIYKKYAGKDLIWLAIDSTKQRKPESNRVYAAELSLAYPILHDPSGKVGRMYGAKTTPHMYIIDRTGQLVYHGAIDKMGKEPNYVIAALDEIFAGKPVSITKTEPYGCSVKYAPLPPQ